MNEHPARRFLVMAACAIAFTVPAAVRGAIVNADLQVVMTRVTPNPASPGEPIVYHITVSNLGPDVATNVVLTDSPPANTTLGDSGGPGGAWNCTLLGLFQCTTPSLAAGVTVTGFIVSLQPVDASVTPIVNTATVSSDTDPNPDNNSSAISTDVAASAQVPVSAAALGILGVLLAVAGAFLGKR
jgi:uncharacterized repeat protein (TIGR01451 family)